MPGGQVGEEQRRAGGIGDLDPAAAEIFQALRAWRLEISRSQRVPPYVVASDSALRSIAASRPRTAAR